MKHVHVLSRGRPLHADNAFGTVAIIGAVTTGIISIMGSAWFMKNWQSMSNEAQEYLQGLNKWIPGR